MERIRVLVVEDSLTVRKRLVEVLGADPEIEVVGEAADGKEGIELCRALRPDVVTLDMMMPVMTGLAATEYIMAYCPSPILIVSSSTNRGEVFKTYDALAAGALDVLEKPTGEEEEGGWEAGLVGRVKLVSRIKVITHPRARLGPGRRAAAPPETREPAERRAGCRLVALGASTGGPGALVTILRSLPPDFPLPLLIVIHLGRPFAGPFAEWLDGQSPLRVAYASDGQALPRAGAVLAPPGFHLALREGKLRLTEDPERHSCRPSVDVLFESVAREAGAGGAGVLLTGMGRDGAEGLLAIRRAGGVTISQDEATSVVYGMPREAALLGAASQVLPLDRIAPALLRLASGAEAGRKA